MNWIEPNEDETIHEKGTFLTSSGKIVIMEINVVRLPNINKKEYPDDFKFSFMVLNEKDEQEYVRLDNHKNKPPHWHDNEKQDFFEWISLESTWEMFMQMVDKKFGKILGRLKQ